MATAQVALDSARTYLNDVAGVVFTNAILLPYLKEAHRDLQVMLWDNQIPVLSKKSTVLTVNANTLTLGGSLPSDLIQIIELKERAAGSTEDWIPMTEKDWEPDIITRDIKLIYWAWREEQINFVGATSNRDVLLHYVKGLTVPAAAGDALGFIFAELFLGPQTAYYQAAAIGSSNRAAELSTIALAKLDVIIRANVKKGQSMPARRIPYRRSVRTRILL